MSSRLESAANGIAPIHGGGFDRTHPEDQLMDAFLSARDVLRRDLPQDATFDGNEAALASEVISNQIRIREGLYASSMESRTDTPPDQGLQLNGAQAQQYYVNKFFSASQGIGAYPAMLGRQAIEARVLTEQEYLTGIEARLRSFSEIIYAGEIGQLKPLVNPLSMGGNRLIIGSDKTEVESTGASGLGAPLPAIPVIIAIAVVSCVLIGGITYAYIRSNEVAKSSQMMGQFCQDAMAANNEKAIKHCAEGAGISQGGLLKEILGDKATSELVKYLTLAAVGIGIVYLLPSLSKSALRAQDVLDEHEKEKRLQAAVSRGVAGGLPIR